MHGLLVGLHVLVAFVMIAVILLQSGKGAEMGAAFGGSSQTIFGSRGPASFLSKLTVVAGALFMVTSLALALLVKERSVASSVIEFEEKSGSTAAPSETAPITTEGSAPAETPVELPAASETAPNTAQ